MNCLSVFDHFVWLVLKELKETKKCWHKCTQKPSLVRLLSPGFHKGTKTH